MTFLSSAEYSSPCYCSQRKFFDVKVVVLMLTENLVIMKQLLAVGQRKWEGFFFSLWTWCCLVRMILAIKSSYFVYSIILMLKEIWYTLYVYFAC